MIAWARWTALDAAGRSVWLDQLLERVPPWLSLVDPVAPLPLFEDVRHGQRFALVPRATVTLGVTAERAEAVAQILSRAPLQFFWPEVALPARTVSVPAHFAALGPLRSNGQTWSGRWGMAKLVAAAAARGLRLPSEAEWELHYRELHPRLALPSTSEGELCLDDWHRGYEGAPPDAAPWGTGAEVVRVASLDPLDVRSVVPARVPLTSAGGACVRPVLDLESGPAERPCP